MIIPTEDQIYERWDELPMSLREALTSEANSDFIKKLSTAEHLPEEKTKEVGRAVSHVLFGFIHAADLTTELKEGSGINPQTVTSIAASLNQRIFDPLQKDIDAVYSPLSKTSASPKILQDMKPLGSAPIGSVPPPAAPLAGTFKVGGIPPPAPQMKVISTANPPAAAAPKSMSDVGWSKAPSTMPTFQTPKGNFGTEALLSSIPRPSSGAPKAPTPEFDKLRNAQQPSSMPATPIAGPAPVIIHEDASFKPAQQTPNFHIPTDQGNFNMQKGQLPIKTAIVEIPNTTSSSPRPIQAIPPKPFFTPIAGTTSQGERHITEITTAPMTPPSTQQPKVVQKDYLGPPQNPPKPLGQ